MGLSPVKFAIFLYLALFVVVLVINYSSPPMLLPPLDESVSFRLGIAIFAGFVGMVVSLACSAIITALTMLTRWGRENKGHIFRVISIAVVILVIIQSLLIMIARNAVAESYDSEIRTFKDIDSVLVAVEPINDNCPQLANSEDSFQTQIELKLRQNGIKVISFQEWQKSSMIPFVYLNVSTIQSQNAKECFSSASLKLNDNVHLYRNDIFISGVATWEAGSVGIAPSNAVTEYVKSQIDELMDKFLNGYFRANPRP